MKKISSGNKITLNVNSTKSGLILISSIFISKYPFNIYFYFLMKQYLKQ